MNSKSEKRKPAKDLKEKLREHLKSTGYPLELRVGNILSSHGWIVDHNRYYIDEDEQKGREIDIVAHSNSYSEKHRVAVWLNLVCEVKQSAKYPWVVLSTKKGRLVTEGEGWGRLHYTEGQIDSNLLSFEEIENQSTTSIFKRLGRSYCEGFKAVDSKSTIFEALASAVKASEYFLETGAKASEMWSDASQSRDITFVEPIVVLEGLLFEAYLDGNSNLRLNQVEHIPISFGYMSKAYTHEYLVEVITIGALRDLILKKRQWITNMRDSIIRKLKDR